MDHGAAFFAFPGDFGAAHPVRQRIGEILLDKTLLVDPAGKALHGQWSALEVSQHGVGHLLVVVDKVALGDLVCRKHHPVRVGDHDVSVRHQRVSLTTSPASLSVRRPW